jgi:Fe-S cluster assembly protein SufD
MTQTRDTRTPYLDAFARFQPRLNGKSSLPLQAIRRQAIQHFGALGFPAPRDEEWRYTSVAPITRTDFVPATDTDPLPSPTEVAPYLFETLDGAQLVFVNGRYVPQLSTPGTPADGVSAKSLAAALVEDADLVRAHLTRHAEYSQEPFTALNTAFLDDGAFVRVARNTQAVAPIQLLFISTSHAAPTVSYPRLLLLAEDNARVSLVESHVGLTDAPYLTNVVAEMFLGPGAHVDHYRIQRDGDAAFHISDLRVVEERDATFCSTCFTLSGRLTRNHVHTLLRGEGIDSSLNGLYLTDGSQHVDNHTLIEHCAPHCRSSEYYKGIMDGQSTGVFCGQILVHRKAQKTDAYQANRNLLLSDQANINTKPQLEIYADDVKCSHGATIGQLDQDAIFYLRSRGIGERRARRLLTRAFADEIVDRVHIEPVQQQLKGLVTGRLSGIHV